ncbi:MAG: glutathione S-transferase family protein, partial [Novosphingobium meiothermophilum]
LCSQSNPRYGRMTQMKTPPENPGRFMGILEQHLGATTFVACERLTIADISMCAYLSYPMDETGIDLTASYHNITAWLDRLMKMPGWKLPYELLPGKRLQRWSA